MRRAVFGCMFGVATLAIGAAAAQSDECTASDQYVARIVKVYDDGLGVHHEDPSGSAVLLDYWPESGFAVFATAAHVIGDPKGVTFKLLLSNIETGGPGVEVVAMPTCENITETNGTAVCAKSDDQDLALLRGTVKGDDGDTLRSPTIQLVPRNGEPVRARGYAMPINGEPPSYRVLQIGDQSIGGDQVGFMASFAGAADPGLSGGGVFVQRGGCAFDVAGTLRSTDQQKIEPIATDQSSVLQFRTWFTAFGRWNTDTVGTASYLLPAKALAELCHPDAIKALKSAQTAVTANTAVKECTSKRLQKFLSLAAGGKMNAIKELQTNPHLEDLSDFDLTMLFAMIQASPVVRQELAESGLVGPFYSRSSGRDEKALGGSPASAVYANLELSDAHDPHLAAAIGSANWAFYLASGKSSANGTAPASLTKAQEAFKWAEGLSNSSDDKALKVDIYRGRAQTEMELGLQFSSNAELHKVAAWNAIQQAVKLDGQQQWTLALLSDAYAAKGDFARSFTVFSGQAHLSGPPPDAMKLKVLGDKALVSGRISPESVKSIQSYVESLDAGQVVSSDLHPTTTLTLTPASLGLKAKLGSISVAAPGK